MQRLAQFAGWLAAHGIKFLAKGSSLTGAVIGYEDGAGQRRTIELGGQCVVSAGCLARADDPDGVTRAVLMIDAQLILASGPSDALVVEAVTCGRQPRSLKIAVPYNTASHAGGLEIGRPSLLSCAGADEYDTAAVIQAFEIGIALSDPIVSCAESTDLSGHRVPVQRRTQRPATEGDV